MVWHVWSDIIPAIGWLDSSTECWHKHTSNCNSYALNISVLKNSYIGGFSSALDSWWQRNARKVTQTPHICIHGDRRLYAESALKHNDPIITSVDQLSIFWAPTYSKLIVDLSLFLLGINCHMAAICRFGSELMCGGCSVLLSM